MLFDVVWCVIYGKGVVKNIVGEGTTYPIVVDFENGVRIVTYEKRTAWEFCELLDKKFMASKKGFDQWLEYAEKNGWIK